MPAAGFCICGLVGKQVQFLLGTYFLHVYSMWLCAEANTQIFHHQTPSVGLTQLPKPRHSIKGVLLKITVHYDQELEQVL